MGRRKKDDDIFWLTLGLFGIGWLLCKTAKVLFSLPKISLSAPQTKVSALKTAEKYVWSFEDFAYLSLFFTIIGIVAAAINEIFSPLAICGFVLYRMFSALERSKNETHIWKMPKKIFVSLCIFCILAGVAAQLFILLN